MKPNSNKNILAGPFQALKSNTEIKFPFEEAAVVVAIPDHIYMAQTDSEGFIKKIRGLTTIVDFDETIGLLESSEYVIFASLVPHDEPNWNSERPCASCPEDGSNCLLCYRRKIMADVSLRKEIKREANALLKSIYDEDIARKGNQMDIEDNIEAISIKEKGKAYRTILLRDLHMVKHSIEKLINHLEDCYGD